MADLKISQLTSATTPLDGTELVPVVQGGVTKKVTAEAVAATTQPSGTANGVAYLNGSKVLTTGSVLTFDGTKMGIGTGSPVSTLDVIGPVGGYGFRVNGGTSVSGAGIWGLDAAMAFNISSSEQMRLTSTGLGIGTSSPGYKLDVVGAGRFTSGASISGLFFGTTPSIPGGQGIVQIGSTEAAAANSGGVLVFTANTTSLANYSVAGIAGKYETAGAGVYSGYLQFLTTNSAGTPTERMRLDSSGNLGLGTNSPGYKLHVQSATPVVAIQDTTSAAGGVGGTLNFIAYTSGTSGANIEAQIKGVKSSANAAGELQFFTSNSTGTSTQRAIIDGSGNLGLGVTPSAWIGSYRALNIGDGGLVSSRTGVSINNIEVGVNWLRDTGGSFVYKANGYGTNYQQVDGAHAWYTAPSGTAGNAISFTQAATLTANGEYLIGLTSATGVAKLQVSGPLRTTGYTVATLPAGTVGMRTYVTDALAPSFGATVVAGGAVTIPVFYNGTNWIVG